MKTKNPSTATRAASEPNNLLRAKMELVAAREQGQTDALRATLTRYPAYSDELTTFATALVATESDPWGDTLETVLADTQAIAASARSRAFAAVFGAAPVAVVAPALAAATAPAISLKALWQKRGLTMQGVAQRLGLGLDVLSDLEAGRIRVASVPAHLLSAFGDLLDATVDQISGAMGVQRLAVNLRSRQGATIGDQTPPEIDFADAIRQSEEMTAEQKALWLD
ncbi:MAG TPA: helix-turn-helix transcriptional regulator [Ktedonobacterales bacterium]|nr:helix-turn-helix transcriptional regulator [Ktedonobacterales bacterium]